MFWMSLIKQMRGGFNSAIDGFHVVGSGLLDCQFLLEKRKATADHVLKTLSKID
jgi:hypothetical protein